MTGEVPSFVGGQPPRGRLRVGTLNTQTVAGRLASVLELGNVHHLDVLCLQETRIPLHARPAVEAGAVTAGWRALIGSQGVATSGNVQYGTAIFTRAHADLHVLPEGLLPEGRGMAARIHRAQARPLLLINLYLPAANAAEAARLASAVMDHAMALGEDVMICGDFNLTVSQHPFVAAVMSGRWRSSDEDVIGDLVLPGTHRINGELTGRNIDFAISTRAVPAWARGQARAMADHDLVFYDLEAAPDVRRRLCAPCFRQLEAQPVDEDRAAARWELHAADFAHQLRQGDVQGAWTLLSNFAEDTLTSAVPLDSEASARFAPKEVRRSAAVTPQSRAHTSTKAPSFQGHMERRLRRFARRAQELLHIFEGKGAGRLQAHSDALQLERKLLRSACELRLQGTSPSELRDEALTAAAQLELQASRHRIQRWREELQGNYKRMVSWITRSPGRTSGHDDFEAPVHPIDKAEQQRSVWEEVWTRTGGLDPEATRDWCRHLAADRPSLPPAAVRVDGSLLRKIAKASQHKASGMDGWAGTALASLPSVFWSALSDLWDAALTFGCLPDAWLQIRVCLLEKEEGGFRPLAITSTVWRILARAVNSKLRSWMLVWADEALLGAVPTRGTAALHAAMSESLAEARARKTTFAGFKADIRKCFDTVQIGQALQTAAWLGLPPQLCALLEHFYRHQVRFIAWQGYYAASPIRPTTGLLQGCPMSPMLLNTVMQAWLLHVKRRADVNIAIFLDDRTCWSTGRRAVAGLTEASKACHEADAVFGLQAHPEKLASFTNGLAAKRQLTAQAELMGPVLDQFKLLGIHYMLGSGRKFDCEALTAKVKRRTERIAMAVLNLATRRRLLQELVISLIVWSGPWQQYGKPDLAKWARFVEQALFGGSRPGGRSPMLAWFVLGRPRLHPEFAVDREALRYEWHRRGTTLGPCPRWPAIARRWDWTALPDNTWRTPLGDLRFGWDSFGAADKAAEHSWFLKLWEMDPKTRPEPTSYLGFRAARQHSLRPTRFPLRVVTACATDARTLTRSSASDGQDIACECGALEPCRTHLTFECAAAPWDMAQASLLERRLLCRRLDLPAPRLVHAVPLDSEVLDDLRGLVGSVTRPTIATDGGCLVGRFVQLWQAASWAVAFSGDDSSVTTIGALVQGVDQTPAAGEREALWHALRHLHAAQLDGDFFLDNEALVTRLSRGAQGSWSGAQPEFWRRVAQLWRPGHRCYWVPSHGKKATWAAPSGFCSSRIRRLNAAADARCTALLDPLVGSFRQAVSDEQEAYVWSRAALEAQQRACTRFHELLVQHYSSGARQGA